MALDQISGMPIIAHLSNFHYLTRRYYGYVRPSFVDIDGRNLR
jgi:hypothetical protein